MTLEKKYNGEYFVGKSFNECLSLIDEDDICESYEWDNADEWD